MKPTLVVLAAGMGSRYGGLKQIDPVGPAGETIIDYSVYDAMRAGFGKLVFVIRRDIEAAFKDTVGRKFEGKLPVSYVYQALDDLPSGFSVPAGRTKPWGTSHAILTAASAVNEPFAVINGDDFYGTTSYRVLAQHLQSGGADYAMVGFVLRNTLSEFGSVARGVCEVGADGYLRTVTERTKIEKDGQGGATFPDEKGQPQRLTGAEIVSLNMWGFPAAIFPHLRRMFVDFLKQHGSSEKTEFYIPTAVNDLVRGGQARLKVLETPDSWFGVTYREDRPRVQESVRALVTRGDYPNPLWG